MVIETGLYLQGDSLKTSIQLDFGDGIKIIYSNLSRTDDGIRHIYRATGIYRVTASAENEQGSDSSMLFLHITSTAPPLLIPGSDASMSLLTIPLCRIKFRAYATLTQSKPRITIGPKCALPVISNSAEMCACWYPKLNLRRLVYRSLFKQVQLQRSKFG